MEMRLVVRMRLGLPLVGPSARCDRCAAAVDALGNEKQSEVQSYSVGNSEMGVLALVTLIVIIIIIVALIIRFKNRMVINKYINDRFNPGKFPNLSKPQEGSK